jgi:hypothetical protein
LFNKEDLNKNFRLIESSKIDRKEIFDLLRVLRKERQNIFSVSAKILAKKANIDEEN